MFFFLFLVVAYIVSPLNILPIWKLLLVYYFFVLIPLVSLAMEPFEGN